MYICICNAITDREIVQAAELGARCTSVAERKSPNDAVGNSDAAAAANPGAANPLPRVVNSDTLLAGASQLAILHNETLYYLRQTRLGKLILTK